MWLFVLKMIIISMYFNFSNFKKVHRKYWKSSHKTIQTPTTHISKLCLKKFSIPDMHTWGTNNMFRQHIDVSDIIFTYDIVICRDIVWNVFRITKMINKALKHIYNIFWEIFLSAHKRHKKNFFCRKSCLNKNQNFAIFFESWK